MSWVGFSFQSITWFELYLSERRFQASIKNKHSNVANTNCGVPQGSILGPLLFLLYVNGMSQTVDCKLFLYADYPCLVYQKRDAKAFDTKLQTFQIFVIGLSITNIAFIFGKTKLNAYCLGQKSK